MIGIDMEVLLHRVYSHCAPEQLSDIPDVMKRFRGRPDELINELQRKYDIRISGLDGSVKRRRASRRPKEVRVFRNKRTMYSCKTHLPNNIFQLLC
jgi:hypothetical protein